MDFKHITVLLNESVDSLNIKEDGIYVGGTKVWKTVKVSNGWIHVIDNVLVPIE